ncbi:MAG: LPS export ABC transporter periplasmic protein LptC [Flavobacteriaceae bacterium]
MKHWFQDICKGIAVVCSMAMLFLSCKDQYKRVGKEAKQQIYPQGIAENFELTYSELNKALKSEDSSASRIVAILRGPYAENFDNLLFPHKTFPKGLEVDFFDEDGNKSIIRSDWGIVYSATGLIDLQGNVEILTHDGKKLETPQLYFDRGNAWIFTQKKFKFTNPQDGTIMDGKGMDFSKDLSFLNAHKTYGHMMIKDSD